LCPVLVIGSTLNLPGIPFESASGRPLDLLGVSFLTS